MVSYAVFYECVIFRQRQQSFRMYGTTGLLLIPQHWPSDARTRAGSAIEYQYDTDIAAV